MKIIAMEPLGVPADKIRAMAAKLEAAGHSFVYYETKENDEARLIERCKEAEILILANQPLRRAVIESCPRLKLLSVAFTGVDHVDLAACRARGIVVCNAAGYSTNAVAELTFGLAIAVIRNIVPCDARARAEGTKDGLVGFELFGKKFGVVGTGAIGARVARIAQAFGCEVYAYSRTQKQELLDAGVCYVELDELVSTCDFVSLHVPLSAQTEHLIDAKRIASMKPNAVLINTARGPVVDNAALAEALNAGKIAGAGIDVFETEPPVQRTHPLVGAKHAVLTPHVAFASNEALYARAEIVFANIGKWLEGKPQNQV